MDGKSSQPQTLNLQELWGLTESSIKLASSGGKTFPRLKKRDLVQLFSYIWQQCPAYPEKSSLKILTWTKLGEYFHSAPRAPPKVLSTWRMIVECLQVPEKGFADLICSTEQPPPYPNSNQEKPTPKEQALEAFSVSTSELPNASPGEESDRNSSLMGVFAQALFLAQAVDSLDLEDLAHCYLVEFQQNAAGVFAPVLVSLLMKLIKDLKSSVSLYGIQASFVKGLRISAQTVFSFPIFLKIFQAGEPSESSAEFVKRLSKALCQQFDNQERAGECLSYLPFKHVNYGQTLHLVKSTDFYTLSDMLQLCQNFGSQIYKRHLLDVAINQGLCSVGNYERAGHKCSIDFG